MVPFRRAILLVLGLGFANCGYKSGEDLTRERLESLRGFSREGKFDVLVGTWRGVILSRVGRHGGQAFVDSIGAFVLKHDKTWTLVVKNDTIAGKWTLTEDRFVLSGWDVPDERGVNDFVLDLERFPTVEGLSETSFRGRFTERGITLSRARFIAHDVPVSYFWKLTK